MSRLTIRTYYEGCRKDTMGGNTEDLRRPRRAGVRLGIRAGSERTGVGVFGRMRWK